VVENLFTLCDDRLENFFTEHLPVEDMPEVAPEGTDDSLSCAGGHGSFGWKKPEFGTYLLKLLFDICFVPFAEGFRKFTFRAAKVGALIEDELLDFTAACNEAHEPVDIRIRREGMENLQMYSSGRMADK